MGFFISSITHFNLLNAVTSYATYILLTAGCYFLNEMQPQIKQKLNIIFSLPLTVYVWHSSR